MSKAIYLLLLSVLTLYRVWTCDAWEVLKSVTNGHGHVTASTNYLWSVNNAHQIFKCERPCKGKWVKVDGALMQIDASDDEVWGVNRNHDIFKRPVDGSGGWKHIGGKLKHVSASGNGYVWGVNNGNKIFKCKKPCNGKWKQTDGALKQIDAGYAYVYGSNGAHLYRRPIDGTKGYGWRHIPAPKHMKYITGSGKDEVFAISTANEVYRCKKPCVGEWEKMSTTNLVTQCDASYDGVFGVSTGGSVYRHMTGV